MAFVLNRNLLTPAATLEVEDHTPEMSKKVRGKQPQKSLGWRDEADQGAEMQIKKKRK